MGKTTVAAFIALALAKRGGRVTLSTTDPAARLALTLDGEVPGGNATRIDPAVEVAQCTPEVLDKAGKNLDAGVLAMVGEDLCALAPRRSPCFAPLPAPSMRAVRASWCWIRHRRATPSCCWMHPRPTVAKSRTHGGMPDAVCELLPRLRDRDYARALVATLPEVTLVHGAERLQRDLLRAGIQPFAWVINQSLLASGTADPRSPNAGLMKRHSFVASPTSCANARCLSHRCRWRLLGRRGLHTSCHEALLKPHQFALHDCKWRLCL